MRMKRKKADSGNVGQKKKKKATFASRLDVRSEKVSGKTKITLGFPVGRSMIGWYFPLQWKTGQIGKMSSFLPMPMSVSFEVSCGKSAMWS